MTYPQLDLKNYNGTTAIIKTNHGKMTVKLFDDVAPKTVKNFIELSKQGYYDGVIFHRIIKDFKRLLEISILNFSLNWPLMRFKISLFLPKMVTTKTMNSSVSSKIS